MLCRGLRNDIAFELNDKLVVLIEHRSTLNDNMPLRMLLYIAETYRRSLEMDALYQRKPIKLLRPEFIVLYNGIEEMKEDCRILRLSDLYADCGEGNIITTPPSNRLGYLELEAPMYNINKGHCTEILKRSPTLDGYTTFVAKSLEYKNAGMNRDEAITQAVIYCIEHDYIKNFLEKHKSEVVNMLETEWNLDTAVAVATREGREEGIEIGFLKAARAMKEKGIDIGTIAEVTELPIDTILKL